MNKRKIYWISQFLGWGMYGFVQVFLYTLAERYDPNQAIGVLFQVIYFILSTHFFRSLILRRGWLNLRLNRLIPRLLGVTFLLSIINYGFLLVVEKFTGGIREADFLFLTILINTLGYWVVYFLWTIFYFAFHYVQRYNKSLKAETAAREVELIHLKTQLNPHFIFNALNSIRALVNEDPIKAKESITQLSHILRNSLMSDRKKLISFSDELKTVMDYLALESIRFEERLKVHFDIDRLSGRYMVPPLMVQTLVENGIKHGISNLKYGGQIAIQTKVKGKHLHLEIRNSGQLGTNNVKSTGFGLTNTRKRLELIFGDQATFEIKNESKDTVLTRITLPLVQ